MKIETASEKWVVVERHEYPMVATESGKAIAKTDCSISPLAGGWFEDASDAKKHAELIVRAVNAHDALAEALECVDEDDGWEYLHPGTRMAVKAALALAKEEKC